MTDTQKKLNKQARKALKRMAQVVNQDLKEQGAVCGGHSACAIGSLWLGAGISPRFDTYGGIFLPGAMENGTDENGESLPRDEFLDSNPPLRVAYDALNAAADRFVARNPQCRDYLDHNYVATIEALFEGCYDEDNPWGEEFHIGRDEMLEIIKDARASLKEVTA